MVAAALSGVQGARAKFIGNVELPQPDSRLCEVQHDNTLNDCVVPLARELESTIEMLERVAEISNARAQHAHVVQHPRNCLQIAGGFERRKTGRVGLGSPREITARIGKDSAVLLNHSEQTRFAGFLGQRSGSPIKSICLFLVATALSDDREAVQRVGLAWIGMRSARLGETLAVTAIRSFRLAALAQQGALPSQDIRVEAVKAIRV